MDSIKTCEQVPNWKVESSLIDKLTLFDMFLGSEFIFINYSYCQAAYSSKGACEIAIASWRDSFFNPKDYSKHEKSIASARAGNVIGGDDWAQDRIIPDCIRALEAGKPIEIRNPKAVRPWQHVLEPLSGYLLLAEKMGNNPTQLCSGKWYRSERGEWRVWVWIRV